MFNISNHYGIECRCNQLQLEPCKEVQIICVLMFILSNHYGIKCLCNLLQLEPFNVMIKEISDIMAH